MKSSTLALVAVTLAMLLLLTPGCASQPPPKQTASATRRATGSDFWIA